MLEVCAERYAEFCAGSQGGWRVDGVKDEQMRVKSSHSWRHCGRAALSPALSQLNLMSRDNRKVKTKKKKTRRESNSTTVLLCYRK